MTKLGAEIVRMIAHEGPISAERYMSLCLGHPQLGYYITRDPLGAAGDFITAPEISQTFGELIGLWCADVWERMGSPASVVLAELGPGRGTLMADALRAMRVVPGLQSALSVHLVETSPVLRLVQEKTLAGAGVPLAWAADVSELPLGPALVIANEFFDALPVRQFVRSPQGWCERMVGLDASGALVWGLSPERDPWLDGVNGPQGAVLEIAAAAQRVMTDLGERIVEHGGALLAIDYGHVRSGLGDSLQAMQKHGFVDPLAAPGESDLTVHVDFAALARSASRTGARVWGPITQGALLRALGLDRRIETLARARPDKAEDIRAAGRRLAGSDEGQMGDLFKVLAVTGPGMGTPAGFDMPSIAAEPHS
jgi:NADH dehydrogenase [ubiquinone] 1 alpha subcomplex assembly factor 7